jgi:CBS domain-containing protein
MVIKNVGELIKDQRLLSMPETATVLEAARGMAARRIGAVPVLRDGVLTGLFTERDLLNRVVAEGTDPAGITLDQVMTFNPVTIGMDRSLADALNTMFDHQFRHLPVMSRDNHLVGVMSRRDIPASYEVLRERWIKARNNLYAVA